MEERFQGWVIHFNSSRTVKLRKSDEQRLKDFIVATGVVMISGYSKDVDWTESSALELLCFGVLQQYVCMPAFWRYFTSGYPDLVAKTGLMAVFQ